MIRDRKIFKTGVQEIEMMNNKIDMGYDFVMVYGFHRDLEQRVIAFRNQGYQVHFMTGIAWGHYEDYLYGHYDGINHWEDAQMDEDGNYILHGVDVPYMVPTLSYTNYFIEKLKKVVDLGVYHIHLEEPEFWQHAGYSKAFELEYEIYYHTKFNRKNDTYDHIHKVAKLKALLYTRALQQIAYAIKFYGKTTYQTDIFVYVPTHSLLNYTQWHLVSPESKLAHLMEIDGFIGQVWAGTSKVQNTFHGVKKERTFETAFLEYGIVSGLNYGSTKTMWFLNDPIEDNPGLTWEQYAYDYKRTLVASLLHPEVNQYEICPWPTRVFDRKLPRVDANATSQVEPKLIPEDYDVILNNTFQMLGDMPKAEPNYDNVGISIGLCLSDTAMYQRKVPKSETDPIAHHKVSIDFPDYYGLALPLLKKGIPLLGVTLDHVALFEEYLDRYDFLILSYEMMKPASPDIHYALKRFVSEGKTLIYIDDDSDPFTHIQDWWNRKQALDTPRRKLFETLGVHHHDTGIYKVGDGLLAYYNIAPHLITKTQKDASLYLDFVQKAILASHRQYVENQVIKLNRGPYRILACLSENGHDESYQLSGLFADMLTKDFSIVQDPHLEPGDVGIYIQLDQVEDMHVIGSTYRIESIEHIESQIIIQVLGRQNICGAIRIKCKQKPIIIYTNSRKLNYTYDDMSQTVLIQLQMESRTETIKIKY